MTDVYRLNEMMQPNHPITVEEWNWLVAMRDTYPYCADLQMMAFQAGQRFGSPDEYGALETQASLRLIEPRLLYQPLFTLQEKEESAESDILKEINDYREVSFKTAPKSVILSHFLNTSGYDLSDEIVHEPYDEETASTEQDDAICTETLARIYQSQGKYDEAIGVYRKLVVKYPEKSAIFARLIDQVNALKESAK